MANAPQINIPRPERWYLTLTIEGDSPLLTHRFSDEAKMAILNKQTMKARGPKGPSPWCWAMTAPIMPGTGWHCPGKSIWRRGRTPFPFSIGKTVSDSIKC